MVAKKRKTEGEGRKGGCAVQLQAAVDSEQLLSEKETNS
jgi:hypothetical protein